MQYGGVGKTRSQLVPVDDVKADDQVEVHSTHS